MKEDYLWDKTGDDAEIRQLEETLAVFRSRADMPPLIVPDTKDAKNGISSWFTGLRLAFAATAATAAAILIVGILIWLPTSPGQLQVNVEEVKPASNAVQVPATPAQPTQEKTDVTESVSPTLAKASEPTVKQRHSTARKKLANFAAHSARNEKPALTAEEKYAYQQLMLALSITNSKLKIVRDTMSGADLDHKTNHRTDKR